MTRPDKRRWAIVSYVRALLAALVAIPVAVGLFFLMQSLIDKEYEQEDVKGRKIADIVVPEREIEVNTKEVKPRRSRIPRSRRRSWSPWSSTSTRTWTSPTWHRRRVSVEISSSGMSSGDGEYLPIVKVAPIYPRRAQTRGITGYCIVEYTVTKSGSIRDPQPVDCQPSGRL
jgi:protein TonB